MSNTTGGQVRQELKKCPLAKLPGDVSESNSGDEWGGEGQGGGKGMEQGALLVDGDEKVKTLQAEQAWVV